jgi:hypothetical protein
VAAYWKNGQRVDLTDGTTTDARANAVYVYNGDVYVAGYYNDGSNDVAAYWKNGVKIKDFTTGSEDRGEAQAIWADASGVYVSGYYEKTGLKTVWYWDGSEHTLLADNNDAALPSLFVKGGDVYTAGHQYDASLQYIATYWKNEGTTDSDDTSSHAYDIFVTGNDDVYIAGDYYPGSGSVLVACYWENDITSETGLPTGTTEESRATSVFVEESTVYTAGYYGSVGSETACYWEGTSKTDLDDGSPVSARAQDIHVESGTVYIAGSYYDGDNRIACYWKDGDKTDLYDSGQAGVNAAASSVFVDSVQ